MRVHYIRFTPAVSMFSATKIRWNARSCMMAEPDDGSNTLICFSSLACSSLGEILCTCYLIGLYHLITGTEMAHAHKYNYNLISGNL